MRTRSKTKKIRENVRRLPHEVEATLSSWVKCTDPIPREILEEVRSKVLVWMKNDKNYVEEAETYILNDEHTHQEVVDDQWALNVLRSLCFDPDLQTQFFLDKGGVEDGRRRDYKNMRERRELGP